MKPCPRCGGEGRLDTSRDGGLGRAWVECPSCSMTGTVCVWAETGASFKQACLGAVEAWDALPHDAWHYPPDVPEEGETVLVAFMAGEHRTLRVMEWMGVHVAGIIAWRPVGDVPWEEEER